jgi:hypothetical protein
LTLPLCGFPVLFVKQVLFARFGTVVACTVRYRREVEAGIQKVSWGLITFASPQQAAAAADGAGRLGCVSCLTASIDFKGLPCLMCAHNSLLDLAFCRLLSLAPGSTSRSYSALVARSFDMAQAMTSDKNGHVLGVAKKHRAKELQQGHSPR